MFAAHPGFEISLVELFGATPQACIARRVSGQKAQYLDVTVIMQHFFVEESFDFF